MDELDKKIFIIILAYNKALRLKLKLNNKRKT